MADEGFGYHPFIKIPELDLREYKGFAKCKTQEQRYTAIKNIQKLQGVCSDNPADGTNITDECLVRRIVCEFLMYNTVVKHNKTAIVKSGHTQRGITSNLISYFLPARLGYIAEAVASTAKLVKQAEFIFLTYEFYDFYNLPDKEEFRTLVKSKISSATLGTEIGVILSIIKHDLHTLGLIESGVSESSIKEAIIRISQKYIKDVFAECNKNDDSSKGGGSGGGGRSGRGGGAGGGGSGRPLEEKLSIKHTGTHRDTKFGKTQ
jgi:uncharacterized membrane protein YgcG